MVPRIALRLPLVSGVILSRCVAIVSARSDGIKSTLDPILDADPIVRGLVALAQTILVGAVAVRVAPYGTGAILDPVHDRPLVTTAAEIVGVIAVAGMIVVVNVSPSASASVLDGPSPRRQRCAFC